MSKTIVIGKLISGTGKGAYFVSLYSKVFQEKLGFTPFPGTLNLKIEGHFNLKEDKKIALKKDGFGDVDCFPIILQKEYKCYLIRPHKTVHPGNILEIVAPVNLRELFHLNDGDDLECELV
ncbi:CTP-dependent riboflavin kinase [Candidatus Woesearchaeota archaeon]|nr:CTP-dependent riboflavin kinase [Candidatus Woesearchaeota archaeon]